MAVIDTSRRHYQRLFEREDPPPHPVDHLVEQMPDVANVDREVIALSSDLRTGRRDRSSMEQWIAYEDLRFRQRTLREERFFDIGFEMGRLAGLAESREVDGPPGTRWLRDRLTEILLNSRIPSAHALAALLDAARALVLLKPRR
jgi:hypothetical protein